MKSNLKEISAELSPDRQFQGIEPDDESFQHIIIESYEEASHHYPDGQEVEDQR
jgi:hypothetical protein